MSTSFPGRIEIGGKLPRHLLKPFVERAAGAGAGLDWADPENLTVERLREWLKGEPLAPLTLLDGEASYGRFEWLEDWLEKHKMSYLTWSDAYYEYTAQVAGIINGVPFSATTNSDHELIVTMDVAANALESLKNGDIFSAITGLSDAVRKVPEVPPFEIISPPRRPRKGTR